VVSLTLVNSLHHWLVIKWLSSMFDVNTSIRMLEFALWLGCVGVQDPWLRRQKSRLWSDVTWLCWYACLFQMDDCDRTMSCHMWSFSLLVAMTITWFHYDPLWQMATSIPGSIYMIILWMVASTPWFMYHLTKFSVMYMYLYFLTGFPTIDYGSSH